MATYFAGLRGTGNFGTDERPKSFREMILWMNPNGSAPLFALTSKGKHQAVTDPEFNWWEETNTIARLQVNGAIADGVTTTIVVDQDDARQLIPGDLLLVEPATQVAGYTEEILRVVSVTNATTIVVERGAAGSTAAAIANDRWLHRIGNAQPEGTRSTTSSSTNPTKYNNYTQIFKTPYQVSKTADNTTFRTGSARDNERKRKTFQHSEKIEQALMWGRASEVTDSTSNQPLRTTMGLRQFIVSNRTVFTVAPTEDTFLSAVYPVFDYESGEAGNERIVFAGNGALNSLNKLAKNATNSRINFKETVKFYGMELQKWILPQGTLYIKSHPLMNVHSIYKNSMFVVNPSGIIYRNLKNRDTTLQKDIQENDADYIKDQWMTECGFEFHYERTMAYLGNFVA